MGRDSDASSSWWPFRRSTPPRPPPPPPPTPHHDDDPWSHLREWLALLALHLAAQGGSSAVAKTAVAPLERARILLQVDGMADAPRSRGGTLVTTTPSTTSTSSMKPVSLPRTHYSTAACLRDMMQLDSLRGLWRGNGANVVRSIPEVTLRFVLYDQFKVMFTPSNEKPGVMSKILSGGLAGLSIPLLLYPLDVARTRLTADLTPSSSSKLTPSPSLRPYNNGSLYHCLAASSFRDLYRGFTLTACTVIPHYAISFATYDEIKALLPTDREFKQSWRYAASKIGAGVAAGVVAQAALYPFDTIRRRMQVAGMPGYEHMAAQYQRGSWAALRHVIDKQGVRGLYRGMAPASIKMGVGACVQFLVYDAVKASFGNGVPSL